LYRYLHNELRAEASEKAAKDAKQRAAGMEAEVGLYKFECS
jgi:hypothetical protein